MSQAHCNKNVWVGRPEKTGSRCVCMFPGVPAPFLLKASLPPLSPASRGEGGLEGKGCIFLCCSPFLLFYTLGCNFGPKASSRMPRVQSGCSSALSGGAVYRYLGIPEVLLSLLPHFPLFYHPEKKVRWRTHPCGTGEPVAGGSAGQHWPSGSCLKLSSITLLIRGVESKTT